MKGGRLIILYLALFLDQLLGDPPNRFHPVAWMGNLIAWAQGFRPNGQPLNEVIFGAGISLGGGISVAFTGGLLARFLNRLPAPINLLGHALLLKCTFSLRGLNQAAAQVETALTNGDLPNARRLLAWHLVSRDTNELDTSRIAAATIESIAENSSDGVIAPIFYYALGGVPLALAYRFVNTVDSMLGYRTQALEWLGKAPARLDDLFNFLPARLTGLLIVLSAPLCHANAHQAWRTLRSDASNTESPNAGYPMSAMAGALEIELEKIGYYRLGKNQRQPEIDDIRRARRVMLTSITTGVVALSALTFRRERRKRKS